MRGQEADCAYIDRANGGLGGSDGAVSIAMSTTIAGCTGRWIFVTFPYGMGFDPSDDISLGR